MSLEGLVREIEDARKMEQARWMATIREQYESTIRAKDEEISVLREEIETLRRWLDHSALPAANPISKRPEALGLIKLNFGKDKPPPEMWRPGEKEVLDSIERKGPEWPEAPDTGLTETPKPIPEPPKPERVDFPEPEPAELHETSLPGPESHKSGKTETPKSVRAARRISRLRGPGARKARGRGRTRKT